MSDADQPKFIVDDDWKSQARAEKEKLAKQDAEAKAKQAEADANAPEGAGRDPNKPLGFTDLIQILATQALSALGVFPDPQTGQAMLAPEMARMQIDLLGVLQEKTKGNLSAEEKTMLDSIVTELRFQYVETLKAVEKAIAEGKIPPDALSGGGAIGVSRQEGGPGAPGSGVVSPDA